MTKLPDLEAAPGLVAVLQLVALEGGAAVSPARKGVTRNDMRSGSEHPARDSEEVQSSNDSKMQLEDIHQERAANLQKALRRRNKFACWAVALCDCRRHLRSVQHGCTNNSAERPDCENEGTNGSAERPDCQPYYPHKRKPVGTERQIVLLDRPLQQRRDNNAAQDSKDAGRHQSCVARDVMDSA